MNYELAKQLKDAGFPWPTDKEKYDICCWEPTLSELIEACGNNFELLTSRSVGIKWRADSWPWGTLKKNVEGKGDTPEEAVARLWIELRK